MYSLPPRCISNASQFRMVCLGFIVLLLSSTGMNAQPDIQHHISAELDDVRHVVIGTDSLIYRNHTLDTLRSIWFRLYPNVLQPGSVYARQLSRLGNTTLAYAPKEQQGEISGLVFRTEGKALRWEYDLFDNGYCDVPLLKPLMPDSSITLLIFFKVSVPLGNTGLLGHSSQSYFLSEWFPKPVLRDSSGWKDDPMYIDGASRGSRSSFRVSLTLPKNYVVAVSGALSEDQEEEKWLGNLEEKTRKMNRWGRKDQAPFPVSAQKTKRLVFTLDDAEDFAFCADKRFYYLSDSVRLESTGQWIRLQLYFTSYEAAFWSRSIEYIKEALEFMAECAGAYPYSQLTVVQTPWSSGGSSHPGLIRIGSVFSTELLEREIIRQVAAQWFGISLSLERNKNYWFHKGLTGYYTDRFLREQYRDTLTLQGLLLDTMVRLNIAGMKSHPVSRLDYFRFGWLQDEKWQPASEWAEHFTRKNMVASGQIRSAMAFGILASVTGEEVFDATMQRFFSEWNGRYPDYHDFFEYLEQQPGIGEHADMFRSLLTETGLPDYALKSCRKTPDGYALTLKNCSQSITPYPITLYAPAGNRTQWIKGHKGTITMLIPDSGHTFKRVTIDPGYQLPELRRTNNTIRTQGVFKRIEKPRLTLGVALPDMRRTQLQYFPVVGWNQANGFMAGLSIYSNPLIRPSTEYLLMPMYGFLNREVSGVFRILHTFRPLAGPFNRIEAGFEAKRYGLVNEPTVTSYQRLVPSLTLHITKQRFQESTIRHRFSYRCILADREEASLIDTAENIWKRDHHSQWYVNELAWRYKNGDVELPFRSMVALQQSDDMMRVFAEGNWKVPYRKAGKGFSVRGFAGAVVLKPSGELPWDYRFTTSGVAMQTKNVFRPHDPLFDQLYLGRNDADGLLAHHFYLSDGGFKRATTVGNTDRWMFTLNLRTTLPGRIPAELFLDAGVFADDTQEKYFKGIFLFSSGVKIIILRDVAELYLPFPFFESAAIRDREKLNQIPDSYIRTVRFVLNLHALNPLTLPGKVKL